MPITASCPGCGQTLAVQDQFAGMQGKCPSCNTVVTFPSAGSAAVTPVPPPVASPPASPVAPPPAMPGPPVGAIPGPPRLPMDPMVLTLIGLGVGTFFFLLLLISLFLNWRVEVITDLGSVILPRNGISFSDARTGISFGDGRTLFCLTLVMLVGVALNFVDRRFLPQCMVVAGAFATFVFLMMLGRIGSGTAGVLLGFFAALGAAAGCIWTAVRQPCVLDTPLIKGGQSFFRTYGALLAAEAVAFGFGVLYWLLRAIFMAA
jgi:hypothetical protein